MANPERNSQGFTEDIRLERGSDAVFLVTTSTQKEVFLNTEEALSKKKQEKNREFLKIGCLSTLGVPAVVFGLGLIVPANNDNTTVLAGVLSLQIGLAVIAVNVLVRARNISLLFKQIKEIKSTLSENAAVKQKSR